MLGFKKLKFDVDEQLPMKHINPLCCNVFNFTPSDGVAPSKAYHEEEGVEVRGTWGMEEKEGRTKGWTNL